MVVNPRYLIVNFYRCIDCDRWRFSGSTIHIYTILNTSIVQNQDRYKTILVIVVGFISLAWIFNIPLLAKIGFGLGAASIFFPFAAKWIEWCWLKLALGLGWINSRILLSIIYFIFLLPIAWIARLFTKDPLMLKARNSESLYTTRNHQYKKEDLENIW